MSGGGARNFCLKLENTRSLFDFIDWIRIIEMFRRDTGKTRNVFSTDYPSTRSNARSPIFHWNELLITRNTSGRSWLQGKGVVIVFHIDRNRISRARRREQTEVNFLKRFTLDCDPRIDIVPSWNDCYFWMEGKRPIGVCR